MYKLEKYNIKQSNKIFHRILITLILVLLVLIAYIVVQNHSDKVKPLFNQEQAKTTQISVNNKTQDWKIIEETFKDECHKQNQLIVLEGTRKIKKVYSTTDDEIAYKGGNTMSFLVGKLNEWKTRYIEITTSYNYIFAYDLNNIDVTIDNEGTAHVKLYRGEVDVKPIAENPSDRVIQTEEGWLSHNFTVQETSAIMGRTQLHTFNNIVNDNDLYEKALHNTEENIRDLALKMGIKGIEVEILNIATLENNEVAVLGDN